jgi:hypothetical protein
MSLYIYRFLENLENHESGEFKENAELINSIKKLKSEPESTLPCFTPLAKLNNFDSILFILILLDNLS